jgi:hypothetical protein
MRHGCVRERSSLANNNNVTCTVAKERSNPTEEQWESYQNVLNEMSQTKLL